MKEKINCFISRFSSKLNKYKVNIHTFDNSKTELSIIISVGATRKLSEAELFDILKEAKSFIKK